MALLVMAALIIGSTSMVFAADKVDDYCKKHTGKLPLRVLQIPSSGLADADIENYLNSGDDFTTSAMQSWQSSKDELGIKEGQQWRNYCNFQRMTSTQLQFL